MPYASRQHLVAEKVCPSQNAAVGSTTQKNLHPKKIWVVFSSQTFLGCSLNFPCALSVNSGGLANFVCRLVCQKPHAQIFWPTRICWETKRSPNILSGQVAFARVKYNRRLVALSTYRATSAMLDWPSGPRPGGLLPCSAFYNRENLTIDRSLHLTTPCLWPNKVSQPHIHPPDKIFHSHILHPNTVSFGVY